MSEPQRRPPIARNQTVSSNKLALAKSLRRRMTSVERALWSALRRNQIDGLHFRRQQPIGDFIVDFYCEKARLVIEVDAPSHQMRSRLDGLRDRELGRAGVKVLRVPNESVLKGADLVAGWIADEARNRIRQST